MRGERRETWNEQIGRRTRVIARSLAGRIYASPTKLWLVHGRPDLKKLLERLASTESAAGLAALRPEELGFRASDLVPISVTGLASRGRALQKWRKIVDDQRGLARKAEIRRRHERWRSEIDSLDERLRWLFGLMQSSRPEATIQGPFLLVPQELAGRDAILNAFGKSRSLAPVLESVAGLVYWIGGARPLQRFLESLRPLLDDAGGTKKEKSGFRAIHAMAALCVGDQSDLIYPPNFVRESLDSAAHCRAIVAEVGNPAYDEMVAAIAKFPSGIRYRPDYVRVLAQGGASVEDIVWALGNGLDWEFASARVSPRSLRVLVERLAGAGAEFQRAELSAFAASIAKHRLEAVPQCLTRWIGLLPDGMFDASMAGELKNLVLTLAVPGILGEDFRELLAKWSSPSRRLPQLEDCPSGLPRRLLSWVRRIGFYQQLLGERPKAPRCLHKLAAGAQPIAEELRHLREQQAAGRLTASMGARLERLERSLGEPAAASQEKWIRDARETCAKLALQSLRKGIDSLIRDRFTAIFGAVPSYLTITHLAELVEWVQGLGGKERAALDEIVAAWRKHGTDYQRHLVANAAWLKQAAAAGVDLDAWLRPPPETFTNEGKQWTIEAASHPFDVFLMGTFFHTCLSLPRGLNAGSVLANAYDANKRVLYLRRGDGQPVARRLLCLNDSHQMVCFRTYFAHSASEAAEKPLDVYCGRWALAAGVKLGDRGRPRSLRGLFWYDDGLCGWSRDAYRAHGSPAEHFPPVAREHGGFNPVFEDYFQRLRDPIWSLLGELDIRPERASSPDELPCVQLDYFEESLAILARRGNDGALARCVLEHAHTEGAHAEAFTSLCQIEGTDPDAAIATARHERIRKQCGRNRFARALLALGTPRCLEQLRDLCGNAPYLRSWLLVALKTKPGFWRAIVGQHMALTPTSILVLRAALQQAPDRQHDASVKSLLGRLSNDWWRPNNIEVEHLLRFRRPEQVLSASFLRRLASDKENESDGRERVLDAIRLALTNPCPASIQFLGEGSARDPAMLLALAVAAGKQHAAFIRRQAACHRDSPAAWMALLIIDGPERTEKRLGDDAQESSSAAWALACDTYRCYQNPLSTGPADGEAVPDDCRPALLWALRKQFESRLESLRQGRQAGPPLSKRPGWVPPLTALAMAWRLAEELAQAGTDWQVRRTRSELFQLLSGPLVDLTLATDNGDREMRLAHYIDDQECQERLPLAHRALRSMAAMLNTMSEGRLFSGRKQLLQLRPSTDGEASPAVEIWAPAEAFLPGGKMAGVLRAIRAAEDPMAPVLLDDLPDDPEQASRFIEEVARMLRDHYGEIVLTARPTQIQIALVHRQNRLRNRRIISEKASVRSLPALENALSDESEEVRKRALEAIVGLGAKATAALFRARRSLDGPLRDMAETALLRLRHRAVPALTRLLAGDTDRERDLAVVEILGRLGPKAFPHLQQALKHRSSAVRAAAITGIERLGRDIVPALEGVLQDEDWLVRLRTIEALSALGPRAVTALAQASGDADSECRNAAIGALGRCGPAAIPFLETAINANEGQSRQTAIESLCRIGPRAFAALRRVLLHDSHEVRVEAVKAIATLGRTGLPLLRTALANSCPLVVRYALKGITRIEQAENA